MVFRSEKLQTSMAQYYNGTSGKNYGEQSQLGFFGVYRGPLRGTKEIILTIMLYWVPPDEDSLWILQ